MVTPHRNLLQRAFVTDDRRLNLFWRILLYMIGLFALDVGGEVVGELSVLLLQLPTHTLRLTVSQVISGLFTVFAILGFTYFFRRRIDRRPWRGLALIPLNRAPLHLLLGILLGSIMMDVIFLIDYAFGWVQITGTEFNSGAILISLGLVFGPYGLAYFFTVGFIEELGFRGYILQNLGHPLPLWLAIPITGVLFGALHFTQAEFGVAFIVGAILITILWSFCRLSTGTLWLAIGWHAGVDWMESVTGLTPVDAPLNGPTLLHLKLLQPDWLVQPETGLVGFTVILLGIVALGLWIYRQKGRLPLQARLDDEGQVKF